MTPNAAATLVQARLGNRSGLDTQFHLELQAAQIEMEQDPTLSPWFLRSYADSVDLSPTTSNSILLSASFLRPADGVDNLFYEAATGEWKPLLLLQDKVLYLTAAEQAAANLPTGAPTSAFFETQQPSKYLRFDPYPDVNYTIRYFGYFAAASTSGNVENVWMISAPDLMIAKAGLRIARYLRDPAAVKLWEQDLQEATRRLMVANIDFEQRGMPAIVREH